MNDKLYVNTPVGMLRISVTKQSIDMTDTDPIVKIEVLGKSNSPTTIADVAYVPDMGNFLVTDHHAVLKDAKVIDNCETESYNCDSCVRNGDCPNQGMDGRPKWEDEGA